jgi:hypothetical protein
MGFLGLVLSNLEKLLGNLEELHKMVNLMLGELKISSLSSLLGESKVSYGTSELEFDSVAITLGFLFFNE